MTQTQRFFVVASRETFIHWCREHGHDPRDPNVHHAARPEHALGYRLTGTDQVMYLHGGDPSVYDSLLARLPSSPTSENTE